MAGGAVQGPIRQALCCGDEPAQRAEAAGGCCVDEAAAAGHLLWACWLSKGINTLLERAGRIAAVEGDIADGACDSVCSTTKTAAG